MNIIELARGYAYSPETEEDFAFTVEELERFVAIVRAEREWVDLTDDEIAEFKTKALHQPMSLSDFARAVIAAFKEKNK